MAGAHSPTSPLRVAVAARRAEAVQLRAAGLTFQQIADRLGYKSKSHAYVDIKRALAKVETESVAELRALDGERLDMLWRQAMQVMSRQHLMVSNGKVVYHDGVPLRDDDPTLRAIATLLQVIDRRARLYGHNAPKSVEVITIDAVEAEIRRLSAELGHAEAEAASGIEAATGGEEAPGGRVSP
jgi:hypothetical protein